MSDVFLGEIRVFGFNYAPTGWALCNGQLLPTIQNVGLYALLGNYYGGVPNVTFALPDLRGVSPIHLGQGPDLTNRAIGDRGGTETVELLLSQIPPHTHSIAASATAGTTQSPVGGGFAEPKDRMYGVNHASALGAETIGAVGGFAHENRSPYLSLNFCIALAGIFPPRS